MPPPRHCFAESATDWRGGGKASAAGHIFVTIDTRTYGSSRGNCPHRYLRNSGETHAAHEATALSVFGLMVADTGKSSRRRDACVGGDVILFRSYSREYILYISWFQGLSRKIIFHVLSMAWREDPH